MLFYKNLKTILLLIIFITIFYFFPHNITASINVDKSQKNINYLAYSEFANEYVYGGEIKTNGYALLELDNILLIYESVGLYQFDSSLKQKSMIEMKDFAIDNQSYKSDILIRNTSNAKVKIIPSVKPNKKYFLIQKKYTTKEKDLENLRTKIADLRTEEKDNLYYLQSVTTDEQKEKNKILLLKQTLQTQAINDQLNDIRKKFVTKRIEIEKKITENFQKINELEFKEQIINKKEYVVNIKQLDTSFIDNNFDSTEVPDSSEIVEGENFLFPENFWNINIFDLDLITTDRKGLFYGYEKNDNRIYILDYSGDLLSSIMLSSDNPLKIYVDKNQIIYVVSKNKIDQYKPNGYIQNYLRPINNNLNVIGSINNEATWSGTINLVGETRIESGAVLTILPGTKVVFSKSGISALNVSGTIKAVGNKDNQIIFRSDTPFPLGEINIYSEENEEASVFTYCRFESMQYGLRIYDASPEISRCIFISNEDALWYQGNKPEYINKCTITKNIFKDNLVGILITFLVEGSNPTIKYNNIYENKKTNLIYKNKINLNIDDNYWGNTEIDKIKQTIINEVNKDVKTDIILDPVLLIPFDIYSDEE